MAKEIVNICDYHFRKPAGFYPAGFVFGFGRTHSNKGEVTLFGINNCFGQNNLKIKTGNYNFTGE
jgi:hypothetical protein